MLKKIIEIDQEKCLGCGLCVNACQESAIELIDGKATLIREGYCDGLGNCLPVCPTNAISFIEKEVGTEKQTFACPGNKVTTFEVEDSETPSKSISQLRQWPVQIQLVPVTAPYFDNADLLIAADCTAFTYGNFHSDFMKGKVTIIGCPKLDVVNYTDKLTEIVKQNNIKSITVARMEVPCCSGLEYATKEALKNSGKDINLEVKTIALDGSLI